MVPHGPAIYTKSTYVCVSCKAAYPLLCVLIVLLKRDTLMYSYCKYREWREIQVFLRLLGFTYAQKAHPLIKELLYDALGN